MRRLVVALVKYRALGRDGQAQVETAPVPPQVLPRSLAASSMLAHMLIYSTDISQSAEQVLAGYAGRWSIEESIQGSKSHLGFEEPQGWSRQAVRRTAPVAMLLYSLTVLWFAREGHALYKPPHRPWYRHKVQPSFADMVAPLRYACLRQGVSATPGHKQSRQNQLLLLPDTLQAVAA